MGKLGSFTSQGSLRNQQQQQLQPNATKWPAFYEESKLVSRMIYPLEFCQNCSLQTIKRAMELTRRLGKLNAQIDPAEAHC